MAQSGGVFWSDCLEVLIDAVEQVLTILVISYLLFHWGITNTGWNTPTVRKTFVQWLSTKLKVNLKSQSFPYKRKIGGILQNWPRSHFLQSYVGE